MTYPRNQALLSQALYSDSAVSHRLPMLIAKLYDLSLRNMNRPSGYKRLNFANQTHEVGPSSQAQRVRESESE